ncbi:MAG TPA: D-amino acid aminotransferase [Thiobacillaceae bacterium]|nr:D-amino acid aminotransferase [Thiobacillaceae bacterium]
MIYLNGSWMPSHEARISVLDRGFLFGDGVYELIPVYARKAFRLEEHLRRLRHSLDGIRLPNPHSDSQWTQLIQELVAAHPFGNQSVYLQITRGAAPRDHAFPKGTPPTVLLMSNPLNDPPPELIENGVSAITGPDIRWGRCDLKTINLLPNVLATQAAAEQACVETVMFRDGVLTEGAASNIFVVKDGVVLAPAKDHRVLPGITYDVVLELAAENGISSKVGDIAISEVRLADELWLTSSSREVQAIVNLDSKPVGSGRPGPVYRRIYALYQAFKRELTGSR